MALRGVYFDWKDSKSHDIGMIAEEVAEVVPEVVFFDESGQEAEAMDYAKLAALLVQAVKEQQETIGQLKRRIETLESR